MPVTVRDPHECVLAGKPERPRKSIYYRGFLIKNFMIMMITVLETTGVPVTRRPSVLMSKGLFRSDQDLLLVTEGFFVIS